MLSARFRASVCCVWVIALLMLSSTDGTRDVIESSNWRSRSRRSLASLSAVGEHDIAVCMATMTHIRNVVSVGFFIIDLFLYLVAKDNYFFANIS